MKVNNKIISFQDNYIQMVSLDYTFNQKKFCWSYVERKNLQKVVVIVPFIKDTDDVILIREFRIPFWNWVISFPAGLVEMSESIETAGLRELKEETGLEGSIKTVSMPLASSVGLTNEVFYFMEASVEKSTPNNTQKLDAVEQIEVLIVPISKVEDFLRKEAQKGLIIDSKVFLYFTSTPKKERV